MKKLVLITFSDPKDTWQNREYEKTIRYFVDKFKKRLGIEEDIEFVVEYFVINSESKPGSLVGKYIREKKQDIVGIIVEAHKSIEINRAVFFMIEMLRGTIPIQMFFFEGKTPKILEEIVLDKMEGKVL